MAKQIVGAERAIAAHLDRIIDVDPNRYRPLIPDDFWITIRAEAPDNKAKLSAEIRGAAIGAIFTLIVEMLLYLFTRWLS